MSGQHSHIYNFMENLQQIKKKNKIHNYCWKSDGKHGCNYKIKLTIQNNVSLAKLEYASIVDNTLNIRHTSTTMNLWTKYVTTMRLRGLINGTLISARTHGLRMVRLDWRFIKCFSYWLIFYPSCDISTDNPSQKNC